MFDVGAFVVCTAGAESKRRKRLGVEIRPGSESRGKSTKGYPGNLRDPTGFLLEKEPEHVARPVDQRPGAEGATPRARGERKKGSQGGNRRAKETKSEGTSSRKS